LWRDIYFNLRSQQLPVQDQHGFEIIITCFPQMTLFSSVLTSPSRVKLAHEIGLACTSEAYQRAAGKHADVATLTTAHKRGMEYTAKMIAGAAKYNKLAEVQHLHGQGCPWPSWLLHIAASSGFFELVRWCYEHGCPWDAKWAACFAAQSGNIELIAWVLQQPDTELCADTMYAAASEGHTAMCQYLHAQQCPWIEFATRGPALAGHVDLLRWLIDSGCPCNVPELCKVAANGGSVEVLSYLQLQGFEAGAATLTDMLDCVGRCNRLAAAKWLREQGAEWPAVLRAWSNELVAWARAEGRTVPTSSAVTTDWQQLFQFM
jgi:hypothetical protein